MQIKNRVNKLLTILIVLIAFTSCSRKTLPQVETKLIIKDSVVTKTDTLYQTEKVFIPGDTVEVAFAIPCPQAENLYFSKQKNKTSLSVKSDSKGNFTVNCHTDSLTHIIDSLKTIISNTKYFHSEEKMINVPVTVIKYKVPKWCWWLLLINIIYLCWKFRSPLTAFFKKLLHLP